MSSAILEDTITNHFEPEKIANELTTLLKTKSNSFMLHGISHSFWYHDQIFTAKQPIDPSKYKEANKCRSCHYMFQNRNEMVFCTFCGISNDAKCCKQTRKYPKSATEERGLICKVCTHKFFAHERVTKTQTQIEVTRVNIVEAMKRIQFQSRMAQGEVIQEQEENEYTLKRLE